MENFHGFCGLASSREGFPANFFFFIIRCFELLYNRGSFPANNKKIMQPRNFSTANDLHYTVPYLSIQKPGCSFPINDFWPGIFMSHTFVWINTVATLLVFETNIIVRLLIYEAFCEAIYFFVDPYYQVLVYFMITLY